MYINTPKDLGKLISKGRKDKGWNQSQLAKHIGIHQPEVSKLENDPSKFDLIIVMKVLALIELDLIVEPRDQQAADGSELGF
ncbi:helix-turn-helix domain-containing protein [Catenovulum agarivorans]|uniref:helix-turn-helix domain-containing protein n=1 Tax=Catenovulum agarivorans TaxID=1172192 RepID=UPI000313A1DD|nr:helix-turn-helix domain-containing protein [Catenovulum agarivorans]